MKSVSLRSARHIGRLELLAWLNELAETDYAKIENCSDGVGYAQVIDAVAPELSIKLEKLNFNVKNMEDKAKNLKMFVSQVKKMGLPFHIEVSKLAAGRF
jgi:hypothetical protein